MPKFRHYTKPNFTIVEEDGVKHSKLDMYLREGTSDKTMINECLDNYSILPLNGDSIILDLGANIGGLGVIGIKSGVRRIISVEPDEFNFQVLESNLNDIRCINLNSAVVGDDSRTLSFNITDNTYSACSARLALTETHNKTPKNMLSKTVTCVNLLKLLDTYKPNIVKIDIEGAEYYTLTESLPPYVEYMAMELHGTKNNDYIKMFNLLLTLDQEWEMVFCEPIVMFNLFSLINVVYKRKSYIPTKFDLNSSEKYKSFNFDRLSKFDIRESTNIETTHNMLIQHAKELDTLRRNVGLKYDESLINF